jgi:hypothetical protein
MSATTVPGFHSITAARRLISSSVSAWARRSETIAANVVQNNATANELFLFIARTLEKLMSLNLDSGPAVSASLR